MKFNRKSPRISLIVPFYNEANYIGALLTSIQTSSRIPDEIILCDNGSTDASLTVINKYKKTLPIKVVTEPKKGIIYAVERAWHEATGDIILRTDADCIVPSLWIERVIRHFHDDPKLAGCTGPLQSSDGNWFDKLLISSWTLVPALVLAWIQQYPLLVGCNSAFTKTALSSVNGFSSEKQEIEDQLISKKLAKKNAKIQWFSDLVMYASSRRFNSNRFSYIPYALSPLFPSLYKEKTGELYFNRGKYTP